MEPSILPERTMGGKENYLQKEILHDWEHHSGYSALSKAYHEKTTKKPQNNQKKTGQ